MKEYLGILTAFLLLAACGGPAYTPPDLSGYIWPRPPEKTRVKLLKVIATDRDVMTKSTADILFGEDVTFRFKKPYGIAVDTKGNIYVTDTFKNELVIINPEKGTIDKLFNPYGWAKPGGVALDEENGLMAATSGSTVLIFDLGTRKLKTSINGFTRPVGLAFDPARKILYISDTRKSELYAYGYDFKERSTVAAEGQLFYPTSIATDRDGNVYVVDSLNWEVKIFSPEGRLVGKFGEHGDMPGDFSRPKGIALNRDGFIFVTDAEFNNFQIFDKEGNVYLYVGRRGRGYGMFSIPQGIAVDKNDEIYVVDSVNRRLQVFQLMTDEYYKTHPEEGKGNKPVPAQRPAI